MKKTIPALFAVVSLMATVWTPGAFGEEGRPTADFSVSALSAYIWRGQELSKNSIVIQPSATVSYRGFSANVWGNLDTKPYRAAGDQNSANWTETDFTLSYARSIGKGNASVGYIFYGLNAPVQGAADPPDSQEIFASIGLDVLLKPTLTLYKEIDHYRQWYALLGISHTFEFHETFSLKLSASASYLKSEYAGPNDTLNIGYPKYTDTGLPTADQYDNFHDGVISAALPISIAKYVTVTPSVAYVFPLSGDAKNEMKGRSKNLSDSSFLYGGVTLGIAF